MSQHIDDRHEMHAARSKRWTDAAAKHRAAEDRALAAGNERRAAIYRESAERAERHARENARAMKRLAPIAPRARTARRLNESSAAARLSQAVELAATTPHPVVLSPKQERKQAKEAEKRARLAGQGDAQRRRDEKAAGVDFDPRTAAGQRAIQIRGPSVDKRASLSDYAAMIHRTTDRTPPRLLALEKFDQLWHRAHAGQFPTPRFERGVDTSRKPSGVSDDRADQLLEVDRLKARIGEEMFAVLYHRAIGGHSFSWMASQGMGEAERLGTLFLAAVDATARHFGLREPSRAVEAMEASITMDRPAA